MKCDVVVVGGGPSGAVCARELALRGYSVILLERAAMPRVKVCGEYINCGSLRQLQELELDTKLHTDANLLHGLRIHTAGKVLELRFPFPALGLMRSVLDLHLLNAARAAGVQVIQGRVTDLTYADNTVSGITYETDAGSKTIAARFTVGADGCGSVIARKLGLVKPVSTKVRYAMGGHFTTTQSSMLEMHVTKDTYLAINPLRAACANVMLIAPKQRLQEFSGNAEARFSKAASRIIVGHAFDADHRIGQPVAFGPLAHTVRATVAPKALLVGDAAGFISPFTGQGVFIALRSARAAAELIHRSLTNPRIETREFQTYDRQQKHERRTRAKLSALLDLLANAPSLAQRVMNNVARHDRARADLLSLFCGLAAPNTITGLQLLARMAL